MIKNNRLLIPFALIVAFLSSFCLLVLFSTNITKSASIESDLEIKVDEVLELSITNCDATNSSVVAVDVIPTTAGTFKSNCQIASVHTNNPGYTVSIFQRNGLPGTEIPGTVGEICRINLDSPNPPEFNCEDSSSNVVCIMDITNYDGRSTWPCNDPLSGDQIGEVQGMDGEPPFICIGGTPTTTIYSTDLAYQNPTTIDPKPVIPSTANTIASPGILTKNTWGFAVEDNDSFDTIYTIDNANNKYAELPTTNTTVYSTNEWPITKTNHKFFYAVKLTPEIMAGTYMTTITYTAVGEPIQPVPCKSDDIICIEVTDGDNIAIQNKWTSPITYVINGSDPVLIASEALLNNISVSVGDIIEIGESEDSTTFRSWSCDVRNGFVADATETGTATVSITKIPTMNRFTTDTAGTTADDCFFKSFASVVYDEDLGLEKPSAINSLPNGAFDTSNITSVGNKFFYYFNGSEALTSLPVGSFDTSNISSAGDYFFAGFNASGSLTSLPAGSFDTSNISSAGDYFFFGFNAWGALTSLPTGSFDISNISSVGTYFFYQFNASGALTSLPVGSFDTSNISSAGDYFFAGFNASGSLTSLPAGSFDTSNISLVGIYFFFGFNQSGALTSLPTGSFDTNNISSAGDDFFYYFNYNGKLQAGVDASLYVTITNKSASNVNFHRRPLGNSNGTQTTTSVPVGGTVTYLAE